jgi:Fur family ferric uptake transcriptional regulator
MTSALESRARKMLRGAKLYCTECRVAILKVLIKARSPLRQEQIAEKLGSGRFNKVSIYRTLATLVETGLVHRAFMHERAWHFEMADDCTETQCHPHFMCTSCGSTHCLTGLSLPMVRPPAKMGFVIHRQQVRLEGLCPSCS